MIWLKNYDNASLVLEYDPATGKAMEVAKDLAGTTSRGFYVNSGHDVVGVYASPEGPIFFVNRERYPMNDPAFGVEHHPGAKEHRFTARRGGVPVFDVAYAPRAGWGYDNWSADEDSADWFLWLTGSAKQAQFYRYYTASE